MKAQKHIASIPDSGVLVVLEGSLTRIYFDFTDPQPREEEPLAVDIKDCENINVHGRSRDDIVSAIINGRYNNNSYQAISANYELAKDPESQITPEKRAEYLAEHASFQEWRAHAKVISSIARNIIESIPAAE